ncbi:MAG: hypothetical protein IKH45_01980 [Neisseriaceae bacterium]|nr:hypothetical protein [Neisseriaceae bacterium]
MSPFWGLILKGKTNGVCLFYPLLVILNHTTHQELGLIILPVARQNKFFSYLFNVCQKMSGGFAVSNPKANIQAA